MAHYGQPSYWEGRYTKDAEPFDWLQRYSAPLLRELINAHIPRDGAILMSGCGSSTMSEDMIDDGYVGGIANVDISRTVIDDLADRLKQKKGLSCASVVASSMLRASAMQTHPSPLSLPYACFLQFKS